MASDGVRFTTKIRTAPLPLRWTPPEVPASDPPKSAFSTPENSASKARKAPAKLEVEIGQPCIFSKSCYTHCYTHFYTHSSQLKGPECWRFFGQKMVTNFRGICLQDQAKCLKETRVATLLCKKHSAQRWKIYENLKFRRGSVWWQMEITCTNWVSTDPVGEKSTCFLRQKGLTPVASPFTD